MTKIKLIIIGHADKMVNFNTIRKHKSSFFKFLDIDRISTIPESNYDNCYLDIVYTSDQISELLNETEFDGLCVAIMNYRFDDNFYLHRVGKNKVCISLNGIENILSKKKISIEDFILKNIYEVFIFHKIFDNLVDDEVYKFVHGDTRGCLFDLNGDKSDIIYNTEQPIICDDCKGKISKKVIPENFINNIQKELKKINKPFIKKTEIFIRKYPLVSILFTFIFSTIINLASSFIWNLIN